MMPQTYRQKIIGSTLNTLSQIDQRNNGRNDNGYSKFATDARGKVRKEPSGIRNAIDSLASLETDGGY